MERPFVWQMIKEAIDNLKGRATYSELKNYINSKWVNVNEATINAQIVVLSVNRFARTHYPENKKPRLSNSHYDILYSTGRGQVVSYNPDEHGIWEIFQNEFGVLSIRQVISDGEENQEIMEQEVDPVLFPIEANLRDFLICNLHTFKDAKLKLYIDETGRDGKEYPTDAGTMDILTTDEDDNFIVFELKLSRGPDRAIGQLLRYMGWIKKNLAKDKKVKGIVVANKMDEKIKYAVMATTDISLYEYEVKFELSIPKD